ncbi:hypothetical protein XELAEV_18047973mg [Xenopus laevis]|uniref:Uncharacterized protein n=1 Tax=Xenopus laevis TaxID=8355 RepID=A0A974H2E8_XENLA|nr:hypothetical protein XELAEV_18047973mg [Xenopus laevis]
MAAKFNGRTYEKSHKKNSRLLDTETSKSWQSQKSLSQKLDSGKDFSLIANEVARLINPVIEMAINKAVAISC